MILEVLVRLLGLYLGATPLYAQTVGATQLLSQGPGAEAAALGGTVVSTVHDPTALYWNPAGLAYAGGAVSGEQLFLFDGARYDFAGLSVPSSLGTFGIGAVQLYRGDIVARTSIDDPGTTVSNSQIDIMGGFGRNVTEHWAVGAAVNVLDFNLAGYTDKGWGVDIGAQGNYSQAELWGLKRVAWSIGAAIKNLIEPKMTLMQDEEVFPRTLFGGVAVSIQTNSAPSFAGFIDHDRAMALLSFKRVFGQPGIIPGVGLAYNYHNILEFRTGYDGYLNAGVGLHTPDGKYAVDYSVSNKPLSIDNRFTLTYRFSPPKSKPGETFREEVDSEYTRAKAEADALAKENYAAGQAAFKDQRYRSAQESFRLAALLEPGEPEMALACTRAREAFRLDEIHLLSTDATLAPAPGQETQAYLNIAALLDLESDDESRLLTELRHITERISPADYAQLVAAAFDPREQSARRLADLGRISDARRIARTLEDLKDPQTEGRVTALRGEIEAKGDEIRRQFDGLNAREGEHADERLAAAALAVKRAFPDDADEGAKADLALTHYRTDNVLTIKESFYLRKLYFLAAITYAKKPSSEEMRRAVDDLTEILRRNAADTDADELRAAVALDGVVVQ